jgi:hypothetical protein
MGGARISNLGVHSFFLQGFLVWVELTSFDRSVCTEFFLRGPFVRVELTSFDRKIRGRKVILSNMSLRFSGTPYRLGVTTIAGRIIRMVRTLGF